MKNPHPPNELIVQIINRQGRLYRQLIIPLGGNDPVRAATQIANRLRGWRTHDDVPPSPPAVGPPEEG